MRILALETSAAAGSVAAIAEDETLAAVTLAVGQRSAQSLAPAIAETLTHAGWRPQDIELIAVTQGPGSFTGLRIGAATAKVLGYAVGAQLLGVNTLEVIAAQAPPACGEVWTLLDAHRGQLFVSRFRLNEHNLPLETAETSVVDIDEWLQQIEAPAWVTGPGLTRVAKRLPAEVQVVDASLWTPQAETVGRLARTHLEQGRRDDVWSFTPRYYRPSAAEEKASS